MVDSHVLVGSCAQIGARVHLAAGVTIGGVLEPPGARPVIVEDDAFVGAGSALLEGVLVGRGAVIAAGVTLTGTSRLYDLVRGPGPRGHGRRAAGRAAGRRRRPGRAGRSRRVRRRATGCPSRSRCSSRTATPGRRRGSRSKGRSGERLDVIRRAPRRGRPPARNEILRAGRLAGLEPGRAGRAVRDAAVRLRPRRHRPPGRGAPAVLPPVVDLAYAVKANPALAVVAHLGRLGLGADVASGGELATVRARRDRGRTGSS